MSDQSSPPETLHPDEITNVADERPVDVVDGDGEQEIAKESVTEPAKVMRIGAMVKQLLDEVHAAPLDEASRERLAEIYERSVTELSMALSPDLQEELHMLALPFDQDEVPTEAELRDRQGAAGRLARRAVPRDPGHADGPAVRRPPATGTDARTPRRVRTGWPRSAPASSAPAPTCDPTSVRSGTGPERTEAEPVNALGAFGYIRTTTL